MKHGILTMGVLWTIESSILQHTINHIMLCYIMSKYIVFLPKINIDFSFDVIGNSQKLINISGICKYECQFFSLLVHITSYIKYTNFVHINKHIVYKEKKFPILLQEINDNKYSNIISFNI